MVETWITAAVMSEKIVMETYITTAPDTAITMFAFMMNR
jgi:hypothetical protein